MNKLPETYLYEVINNRRVIKLEGGVEIRSPKSLYLTKEDVLTCLEYAYVYRRFADSQVARQRVTKFNLDRLHRANYISEEEWNAMQNTSPEPVVKQVEEPIFEKPIIEEPSSETVEDTTVIPDEVEELTPTNGDVQENPVESETDIYYEVEQPTGVVVDETVSTVTEDSVVIADGNNVEGMGVPETSDQNTQPNAGKHYYKHNKKNTKR